MSLSSRGPGCVCLPNRGPYLAASYDKVSGWRVNIRMAEMRQECRERLELPQIVSESGETKTLIEKAKYYHYYDYSYSSTGLNGAHGPGSAESRHFEQLHKMG